MSRPNNKLDSRLDDELRNAFRREQPSADFTTHLLERVSRERQPRQRWWTKLAMLLEPPRLRPMLRWTAIGVTASLLLAIGAMQYSKLRHTPAGENGGAVAETSSADARSKDAVNSATFSNEPQQSKAAVDSKPDIQRRDVNNRRALARHQEERELRAEGEAAKETLMLALSIASSALNDAQKAVHDDPLRP